MKTYSTSEIAEIIGIHPNTVILYEKWGYIAHVERRENGYRVYTEKEIKVLKVIKILRQENYSTQCVSKMIHKVITINETYLKETKGNALPEKETAADSEDRLLSSIGKAEEDVKELITSINDLIEKSKVDMYRKNN